MRKNYSAAEALFWGIWTVIIGLAVYYLVREHDNRQARLKQLRHQIDQGFENDYSNLKADWGSIKSDINKAYEKLKVETNEASPSCEQTKCT